MNQDEINAAINDILVNGYDLKDVEKSHMLLISLGEKAIPHIVSALNKCADGYEIGRWWDGVDKLCNILSSIQTESAKNALLAILKTDSRIVEFDIVRNYCAKELTVFKDKKIIPELLAISKTPNAPILSIKKTIEALGGEILLTPNVILAEVSNMDSDKRFEHFKKYHEVIKGWTALNQSAYYYWIGIGVENSEGPKAALPFYAASLKANPNPDAAAWSRGFQGVPRTPKMAMKLAIKYPLSNDISNVKTEKRDLIKDSEIKWWQFWK